ncbi:MAG: hypothetical protein LBV68_06965 [Spirochaetaceae bacterium]|jgi:Na+-transporting NADH:ubiquinone oxidoreductase subunit NqrD|nr:hypothetical protein [Spirochaetaceae bacterium]
MIPYNRSFISYLRSPFTLLNAAGIIIIASSRLAYALISVLAIIWVYSLSVLITNAAKNWFPKILNNLLSVFLFSLLAGIFYLFVYILNPFLAREVSLLIALVPTLCFASGICLRAENHAAHEALYLAFYESLGIGVFIIALSLIREPLGYGSLSVPGSLYAVYELFHLDMIFPIPLEIMAGSTGALLLLGYIFIILRMVTIHSEKIDRQKKTKAEEK